MASTVCVKALGIALAFVATGTLAQLVPQDPDWQEVEAPAPPALRTQGLVPLDLGRGTDLRWGVDPQSISIGADRIVRYVVVAQGQDGAVNGIYEGIKCGSGEVRVYARHARDGQWVPVRSGEWKSLYAGGAQRHSLAIARSGACMGEGANTSAAQVARDLASNPNSRFRNEYR
jgi:hypothetical protein